jgi:hypothetical protein
MALAAHKKKPLGSGGIVDYEGLWGIEEIFVACDKYNELAAFAVPFFKIFCGLHYNTSNSRAISF